MAKHEVSIEKLPIE